MALTDEQKEVVKETVKGIMEEVRGNAPVAQNEMAHVGFHIDKIDNGYLIDTYGRGKRVFCETKDAVIETIRGIL